MPLKSHVLVSLSVVATSTLLLADLAAQQQTTPDTRSFDLATLFELNALVEDRNGDSVPDFVRAAFLTGRAATPAELRAAAEIAARLGFETSALDLPMATGTNANGPIIAIGQGGLAAWGGDAQLAATDLAPGEGVVAVRRRNGRESILVWGADDAGLQAAARAFAGALPHTRTISSQHLGRVRDELVNELDAANVRADVRLTDALVRADGGGIAHLVTELGVDRASVDTVAAIIRSLATRTPVRDDSATTDSVAFRYRGLDTLEVRVTAPEGVAAVVRFNVSAEPDPPGPIPGRPGSGTKRSLDLSNLYTHAGLLGDGDDNLIPDRIDALLVPSDSATNRLVDLAARLGLESTGLVVPLVAAVMEVDKPASKPTMVLVGRDHRLIDTLVAQQKTALADLQSGEGIIQIVPKAFGEKPALVISGADRSGVDRALEQVAETFPHIRHRGRDRPTLDDVEYELWATLSGRTPAGQAAIGLYKLDRIIEKLAEKQLDSAHVLISMEKPDSALVSLFHQRAGSLRADRVTVAVDNRDVQNAATIFDETLTVPSEVDRFWSLFNERIVPRVTASRGSPVRMELRISEPPDIRERMAKRARDALIAAGADPSNTDVTVLSAFKQGYSWLYDHVRPQIEGADIGDIVIRFLRNEPPADWPQQAIHTPVRWLHEIFPIDEVLARELDIDLDRIRFEMVNEGPTYEVTVTASNGSEILRDSFDPRFVLRPYFDRFRDYEQVRVTTGWVDVRVDDELVVSERLVSDPEWFWDYYQSRTLPAVYDYVMDRHDGNPRGGASDAPFFGELVVELEMSEPHYLLDVDKELIAPMDALHEEIYFGTLEFFHLMGRNARGQDLTYPGRVIPIMRPKSDGTSGRAHIRFSGFATSRPAIVVSYREASGETGEMRLDIPRITMERPSARIAKVRVGEPGVTQLDLRVRVDTDADERDQLLTLATKEQVDERMLSATQVVATLENIQMLRAAGMYASSLAFPGLGNIVVNAEWTHEDDPESRRTVTLAANGTPRPLPDWSALVPEAWSYGGERLVQWDTPIPPPEGHRILAQMAGAFAEATMYKVGESYLGKDIWALDLMSPVHATHWSHAKASMFKPTVIYSARQHANEVSSTSHVLRHAELLLTDPGQRKKLEKVNVVIHPFTNPDGAQLAYDLFRITPELILHAGYLASLGMDPTSGSGQDFPLYPETNIRRDLWEEWRPDIFLNPHGYPSHQVVQLFSEYTGLVRRGRVTERNWGFNKGWFMPGFRYVDDPRYPRHKDAAFTIRDYITRAINSNRDVFAMNQRNYERYRRYGAAFDPDVFRLPMTDSVLIQMPLKGSRGESQGMNNPKVTIWSGTTEAPDETAHGEWLRLVATAGLSWDQAILDYLYDGNHEIERSGSSFFGGVTLKMDRPRPPKDDAKSETTSTEPGDKM